MMLSSSAAVAFRSSATAARGSSWRVALARKSITQSRRWETVGVPVPTMGESITEGTIQTWKKKVGQMVEADEIIAIIDTDKISVDVNSPVSGKLISVEASDGETVYVGNDLFKIDTEGEASEVACEAPTPSDSDSAEEISSSSVSHDDRKEVRVPMSRMRLRIAERLKSAQDSGVLLTTFQECDMTNVMKLRKKLGPAVQEKFGTKLGFMSFFMSACAKSLQQFPSVNGSIDGKDILERNFVDISVAVATPSGLTVPVVRDVQKKTLVQLEKDLIDLAKAARESKLSLEQMTGGTFTISNGGVYGSLAGTPIINPPQSAILGMHSIIQKPVVRDGQIVARPIMKLALTYDHRIVDGREAVSFLKAVADYVEQPTKLLMDL